MGHAGAPQSCAQFVKGVSERRTRTPLALPPVAIWLDLQSG